jgi:hypothetical protein
VLTPAVHADELSDSFVHGSVKALSGMLSAALERLL